MADAKTTALAALNSLNGTDVVFVVRPGSPPGNKATIDTLLAYARTNMYPQVATYADLPVSTNSGNIYIVQGSTGVWPLRKYAGFWRDTGTGWVWLGNATWIADEIGFTPTGNIAATDVSGALAELDTEKQPLAANLTAIGALVSAADKLPYFTGSGTAAVTTFTAAGRALIDDADAAAQRITLGLGTVATLASDTDTTLAANSDARVATQKATKAYVDAAVTGLLDFKGSTDCSANPNYPAALKGDAYVVSVAGKIGGAAGLSVDVGDVYLAIADNAGGTQAAVGASWDTLEHNLVGALLSANNLSDLANAATARGNLGLGTAATQATGTFALVANNLSDLANAGTARTNLGLGSIAVEAEATAAQIQAGTASKAVAADKLLASAAPQTLTDAAPTTWDMSLGYNAKWTLGASRTLSTPTNPVQGMTYSLNVVQDGTGSRLVTWPAAFDWGTAGAPLLTTTASKRDRITLFCTDAATPKFDAFLSGKGFS
jgi:hypothetical protein